MKAFFSAFFIFFASISFSQTLSLSPDSVYVNESLNIIFSGTNVNFIPGTNTTTVYLEQGSSTIYPNSTSASTASDMQVSLSIPSSANLGYYTAVVFGQASNALTFPNALLVKGYAPGQSLAVQPDSVNLGENLSILFSGTNLNFNPGTNTTTVYFQQGSNTIYPNQTYAYDANHMAADFTIPTYAGCGSYNALIFGQGSSTVNFPNALFIDCSTNISGTVYNDLDSNGIDDGEPGMPYSAINIQPGNIYTYSDYYGNYSLPVAAGSYQVSVVPPLYYTQTSAPAVYTANTALNNIITGLDFGLHEAPVNDLGIFIFGPHPRVGYSRPYWVCVYNVGTTTQTPTVTLTLDSNLSISSCAYPYTVSGNVCTITPSFALASNEYLDFELTLLSSQSVPLNQDALIIAGLTNTLAPDQNPSDNIDTLFTYFVNSFDPNEKTVSPAGKGANNETLKSSTLQYHIGFQNTGNDTAYLVQIVDTLDPNLDLSTFKLLGSSSPVTFSMKANGIVNFTFSNINLPPASTDPINSNGYVGYSLNPKPGIADNTIISNTASIYFDFNPAVVTNTTISDMVTAYTGINNLTLDNSILIYPNPSSDMIYIADKGKLNISHIAVYDMVGALMYASDVNSSNTQINTSIFSTGMYMVKVQTQSGEASKKITVIH